MAQLHGNNREESYKPSYGSGQSVYIVGKAPPPVENNQAKKKPLVINYYPSGPTVGPKRYIAEVETISREVVRHPGTVTEPMNDYRTRADSQSARDEDFITKLQDGTIKASSGKLLGMNLDQHKDAQAICEDNVCRIIQPGDHHGSNTIKDEWSMQPNTVDQNDPERVASLVNKVSNWRGVYGSDRGKSSGTYNGWNNNPDGRYGYNDQRKDRRGSSGWNKLPAANQGYNQGHGGDTWSSTNNGNSHYGGYGGRGKPDDSYTGSYNNPQAPRGGSSYNEQGENYGANSGWNKLPTTHKVSDQTMVYGGDIGKKPSSMNGYYGSSDNMVNGDRGRLDDNNMRRTNSPQAPRPGSGYTSQTENFNGSSGWNKALPSQQGYDQDHQAISYGSGTHKNPSSMNGNHNNSEDMGYGNRGKQPHNYTGRNNSPQKPRPGSGYTNQTDNFNGSSGQNKPLSAQQGYDQPIGYGGATHKNPSSMDGNYNNSKDMGYGNPGKLDDSYRGKNNYPQPPRGGYDYNETRVDHDGGSEGRKQGYGYGDGIVPWKPSSTSKTNKQDKPEYEAYGNGYNSSSKPNIVRPVRTYPTITGREAVTKYNGTFVR